MRFVYILLDDKIQIEVQQNRDRLSPFIRTKKQLDDLENKITIDADKRIFKFLKLFNQTYPPYSIPKEFIFIDLISLLKETNFVFFKKGDKSSLKRLNNFSILGNMISIKQKIEIKPNKIKILIHKIFKTKVAVDYYFDINELQSLIPIDYDLFIPITEEQKLGYIDEKAKNTLFNQFYKITNKTIENSKYLSFGDLNALNENDTFNIQYQSVSNKSKSISFSSNKLFEMNIFNKDDLKDNELDFYYTLLKNYLQNKNFIDYNNEIILIDEKDTIKDIDSKTLLNIFSYDLKSDIRFFINKLSNIESKIDRTQLLTQLKQKNFNATLKYYQEDGVLWLYNLYKNNIDGGLLADEMGLGKTIQVIAFLLLSNVKNILIISPASLIHNWKSEILKFTNIIENEISLSIEKDNSFITILSYETARSKIDLIKESQYDILIMDESQKIKNHQTQIFNAVNLIKRDFTIIMTGTPIENSLNDLWNMLFTINPSLYELYIQKIQPLLNDINTYHKAIELTIKMLYPIMLQRRKDDVLDLPKRETKTIFVELSKNEKEEYQQLVNTFISAIKSGLSGRVQSIALEGLLRLRQYCSIHSIVPNTLLKSHELIDSKLDKILDIVKDTSNKNEKTIIFSQFTSSLDKIEIILNQHKINFIRLDGSTTKKNRDLIVKQFQTKNNNYNIFLISLKTGGVGLNLTTATNAVLVEPWWNPAVEEQAFARIDRIGQEKETKIFRLIYKDSIEEKINNLIKQKQNMFVRMTNLLVNRQSLEMEVAKDIFKMS